MLPHVAECFMKRSTQKAITHCYNYFFITTLRIASAKADIRRRLLQNITLHKLVFLPLEVILFSPMMASSIRLFLIYRGGREVAPIGGVKKQ
ncbi:hypothetical protein KL86DPRO_20284 [uncultured delta proteobacterium]|uniref:Uncharacterized protein n=1 Tax=uncultured delta proteobacterium TaxID=34034 RepID=A0A212JXN9_9DELT|nr:hypothetical protein KL86DPRO_20284 [uncultured delta proteobacterium]